MLASRKQRDRDRSNTPRRVVRGHQPVLHACQKDPDTPGGRAGRADAGFKLGGGFRRGADDSEQWSEAETGGRRNRGTPLDALTIASSITVMDDLCDLPDIKTGCGTTGTRTQTQIQTRSVTVRDPFLTKQGPYPGIRDPFPLPQQGDTK